MSLVAKRIFVKGKVQGVFFRKYTRQTAEGLDITGWVKNTDDGNVEIWAQGEEAGIQRLIAWCREGPPKSEVKDVEIKDADPDNNIKHFSIEY